MQKKIICIGLIGMFLLTSFTALSASAVDTKIVREQEQISVLPSICMQLGEGLDDVSIVKMNVLPIKSSFRSSSSKAMLSTSANHVHNIITGEGFVTIQAAINDIDTRNGHTILVDPGIYYENVIVTKSLSIIGGNKENTIIDGMQKDDTLYICSSSVKITGFTIRNGSTSMFSGGIHVAKSKSYPIELLTNINISNCIVETSHCGIRFTNVNNVTIADCNIKDNIACSIYIIHCSQFNINNCEIYNNGEILSPSLSHPGGVWITSDQCGSTENIIITGCNIFDNIAVGIFTDYNCWINIYNNLISGHWNGIFLSGSSASGFKPNNIFIHHNNVENCLTGIGLQDCNNGITIYENNLSYNKKGINLLRSSSTSIYGNDIKVNIEGIYIRKNESESNYNKIYHNNFIDNDNAPCDPGLNYWDDGYPSGGNYWDDYTGEDADGDGIGDTPYDISGGSNQDVNPLMTYYIPPSNVPPGTPIITGTSNGKAGTEYEYKFISTDPDENPITYCIDWGDNTIEVCIGPYPSDVEASANHTWPEKGSYTIKVKAKDTNGAESEWATFKVSVSKIKTINMPILNFLKYIYSLSQKILQKLEI